MSDLLLDSSCNASLSFTISKLVAVDTVHDYDHDLSNWFGSSANILIEIPYMTSYLKAIVRFSISITVSKIPTGEMCTVLTMTFGIGQR